MASPRRFGRYELVELLGRGGMAEVWKARFRGAAGFERTLVVKRILPQLVTDEDFVAMFMREAQLCSMLSHANIVQVFELGELEGEYYLAMEYVNGKDVLAVVRARPKTPPPPGFAVLVARDVCRALAYAYDVLDERGQPLHVIHRDVTPSNIMVTVDGSVKLVDFGVAKALNMATASLTNAGGLKGKLGYASPEQLLGKPVDHRTDLYSVGIVAHELLTGRRLFQGETDQESVELALSSTVYPPSRINPQVPPALDAIVLRALERDPASRFQSATELADALEPFVHALAFGPQQLGALLRERFDDLAAAASSFEWIDDAVTDSQGAMPVFPGSDADAERSVRHAERHPTTACKTASYVNTIDDMGAWMAAVELRDTQEHAVVPDGVTSRDLRPTLKEYRLRAKAAVPVPPDAVAPPPAEVVTTGDVRGPQPASRGVLWGLAFGAGGAVVGALGLLAYLHFAPIEARTEPSAGKSEVSAPPRPVLASPPLPPPPPALPPPSEAPLAATPLLPDQPVPVQLAPVPTAKKHRHSASDDGSSSGLVDPFASPRKP